MLCRKIPVDQVCDCASSCSRKPQFGDTLLVVGCCNLSLCFERGRKRRMHEIFQWKLEKRWSSEAVVKDVMWMYRHSKRQLSAIITVHSHLDFFRKRKSMVLVNQRSVI